MNDSPRAWVHRCVEMIERLAPRLMRAGGGGLAQECPQQGRRMPPEICREVLRLRRDGKQMREIADEVGYSPSAVSRQCRMAGMPHVKVRSVAE